MSKKRLKTIHKSLAICFLLLLITITLDVLGFTTLRKFTFYAIFPVFFWGYFHGTIFVFKANKKFFSRIKHKQAIFTDSLTDDEGDPPYIKPNDSDKNNDSGGSD